MSSRWGPWEEEEEEIEDEGGEEEESDEESEEKSNPESDEGESDEESDAESDEEEEPTRNEPTHSFAIRVDTPHRLARAPIVEIVALTTRRGMPGNIESRPVFQSLENVIHLQRR